MSTFVWLEVGPNIVYFAGRLAKRYGQGTLLTEGLQAEAGLAK